MTNAEKEKLMRMIARKIKQLEDAKIAYPTIIEIELREMIKENFKENE